jgi:hypothetical protein
VVSEEISEEVAAAAEAVLAFQVETVARLIMVVLAEEAEALQRWVHPALVMVVMQLPGHFLFYLRSLLLLVCLVAKVAVVAEQLKALQVMVDPGDLVLIH